MEPSDVPDTSATVLYIGNMDKKVTEQMMLNILRQGLPHVQDKILSAKMFPSPDNMQDRCCFIHFHDNNAACQAMTFLNGRDFCGKKVKVNWATNTPTGIPKVIGSSVTIFVGDLDDELTDAELRQAFEPCGEILNAKVVRDPVTEKSKNYGFVSFSNKPDAEKAIREMYGAMLRRRPIKTNWATRNQNTKPDPLEFDQVIKESDAGNCTVYVTNLPDRISEDVLMKHFEDCGKVVGSPRVFDGKNYAFIRFDSHTSAATAIVKGNGSDLNGAILKCWWGKDSEMHHNVSHVNRFHQNSFQPPYHPPQPNLHDTAPDHNTYMQQQQQHQMLQQMYNAYYQQQYYQYWMQQYQQHSQQNGGGYQQYPQQQGSYNQPPPQGKYPPNTYQS